jgi:hypothetical protein
MKIAIAVDDKLVRAALRRAPEVMERHIGDGLERGADELARAARDKAPKLWSTLTHSIMASREGKLHFLVRAGINYARAVEEGTGPAAGRARYYPNPASLEQYLMHSPRMRGYAWAKKGSKKRAGQEASIRSRSRALARFIYEHGTRPRPFMAPALDEKDARIRQLVRLASIEGARGVFA